VPKTSFKLNQAIITGKSVQQDYITPADLYRGAVINVFGNHITIVDVDKAAEDWHVTLHSHTSCDFALSHVVSPRAHMFCRVAYVYPLHE
jgi:hypothetical protein